MGFRVSLNIQEFYVKSQSRNNCHSETKLQYKNSLPDELRNSDSFDNFKRFMKTILFSRY